MTNKITFTKATAADFEYFYALRKRTMYDHFINAGKGWDEDEERTNHTKSFNVKTLRFIHLGAERIGCIDIADQKDSNLRISLFCIEPKHQNSGIGTQVLQTIIKEAQQKGQGLKLDVLKVNQSSALYKRLGFTEIQGDIELLDYYKRPLGKQLKPPQP